MSSAFQAAMFPESREGSLSTKAFQNNLEPLSPNYRVTYRCITYDAKESMDYAGATPGYTMLLGSNATL